MNKKRKIQVPVILGPTAIGKTEISLRLASDLGFEILSCDSRQIYRNMDIGTAKPSREEMAEVRHWMIDIIDPSDYYSTYWFSQEALKVIRDGVERGITILICGGTGLYYKSLCDGLGPQVASNFTFRKEYSEKILKEGRESIFRELQKYDPETAARLHPNDIQRVVRALQVYYQTGYPLSEHQKRTRPPEDIEFLVIILSLPRPVLYKRINRRVDNMVSRGLFDEFCFLRKKGYNKSDPGMHCVGYKELFEVENTSISLLEAVEKIKRNSRNYAKRQTTWFTHKTEGIRVDVSNPDAYYVIKQKVMHFLKL